MRVNTADNIPSCSNPFLGQEELHRALLRACGRAASKLRQTVTRIMRARFDAIRLEDLSDSQLRDIGLRRDEVEQIDPIAPLIFGHWR